MAILNDVQCTKVRHELHANGLDLLQAELPALTKTEIKAALQTIEDWYESERANIKVAVDTAIGRSISNSLAKKLGKYWMKLKWGLE